jgi:hypothetical protein
MPSPHDNALTLASYWKSAAMTAQDFEAVAAGRLVGSAPPRISALVRAIRAMKELCSQAARDPNVRLGAFAGSSIFETALLVEDGRWTRVLLEAARERSLGWTFEVELLTADQNLRSPRQIMLDSIHSAGTAGIFSIKDPSGLTSWLKSVHAGGIAITAALKGDPDGRVRAALLRLLRDCAIPEELARQLKTGRTFEGLAERLAGEALPVEERRVIQVLGSEADARVTRDLAELPTLGQLPAFPTGDGALAPTLPPAVAWYRRPGVWITSALGIVAGGVAAGNRSGLSRPRSRAR